MQLSERKCLEISQPLLSWPLSLAEFFIAKGVPVSAADHQGRTALHLCVSKRASNAELILPVVRALVAAKVAVNSQDNKGRAALHLLFASASRSDPIEIASDLCTLDVVQLNVQDKHKRTPLHFAGRFRRTRRRRRREKEIGRRRRSRRCKRENQPSCSLGPS